MSDDRPQPETPSVSRRAVLTSAFIAAGVATPGAAAAAPSAELEAFEKVGYKGYLTFEYFHPFPHYPEALIYQTSDALDRMLGRNG